MKETEYWATQLVRAERDGVGHERCVRMFRLYASTRTPDWIGYRAARAAHDKKAALAAAKRILRSVQNG